MNINTTILCLMTWISLQGRDEGDVLSIMV